MVRDEIGYQSCCRAPVTLLLAFKEDGWHLCWGALGIRVRYCPNCGARLMGGEEEKEPPFRTIVPKQDVIDVSGRAILTTTNES